MGFLEFLFWCLIGKLIIDFILFTGKAKKELHEELKEEISSRMHIVNVEQHGDIYYWFDNDNGEFLAQGKTLDDIVSIVKSRFPDHFFYLNNDIILHGPDWKFKKFEV